jgi:hypothetical protein
MEPVWTFLSGQPTRTIQSDPADKDLERNSVQPTIHVELTDFNIESWSGESSDCDRAAAIVPSERWEEDCDTGVLHYNAPYSIPIDLNVPTTQPYYSLQCRLRNPDVRSQTQTFECGRGTCPQGGIESYCVFVACMDWMLATRVP